MVGGNIGIHHRLDGFVLGIAVTDVNELTPTIVNSLIDRIEVHNNDKSGGHCYVKVDIYFSAVGMIDIPTAEEIRAMIEEIKKDPQQFRYVA